MSQSHECDIESAREDEEGVACPEAQLVHVARSSGSDSKATT